MPRRIRTSGNHSRRPVLIVLVLLACLVLTGALGWQSLRLLQSNSSASAAVLRDYAALAAEEFGRRFTESLGYYGYLPLIRQCDKSYSALGMFEAITSTDSPLLEPGLVETVFWYDGIEFSAAGRTPDPGLDQEVVRFHREETANVSERGRDAIAEPSASTGLKPKKTSVPALDDVFAISYTQPTGKQFVYRLRALVDGTHLICGFVVDPEGFAKFVQRSIDWGPLLPPSLAGGMVGNELLYIEVFDREDRSLFKVNPQFHSYSTVRRSFARDKLGILDGFSVRVALDPYSASNLIIGGLPRSRLPLLFAILATALLLLLTAIWLFRREQSVIRLREDFISQVSHELRTPLTQIRMFAETLLLNRTRDEEDRRRSLAIIDRESKRLSLLVENVLRVSKVSDAVPVTCEVHELSELVKEVCESFQATIDKARIRVSVRDNAQASVDAGAVRQVLTNLLDNAVKYGPVGQTVRVSLESRDGFVRIRVEDEGPGIPDADRDRVWDTFFRLGREKDAAISGTGIGLSVVRELVQAMRGRCWFEPGDKGAVAVVEFPEVTEDD